MADETEVEVEGTVYVRGEGGGLFEMSLPLPEAIQDRVTKGYLRLVNADGSELAPGERQMPAKGALKAEWVGWAVHKGADVEDAEAATKDDLIDLYGGS